MRSRRSRATVSKALLIMGYSSSTSLKLSTDREQRRQQLSARTLAVLLPRVSRQISAGRRRGKKKRQIICTTSLKHVLLRASQRLTTGISKRVINTKCFMMIAHFSHTYKLCVTLQTHLCLFQIHSYKQRQKQFYQCETIKHQKTSASEPHRWST